MSHLFLSRNIEDGNAVTGGRYLTPQCLALADLPTFATGHGSEGQTAFLLREALDGVDWLGLAASKHRSPGFQTDRGAHIPTRDTVAVRLCALSSGSTAPEGNGVATSVTVAFFSDLACTRPAAFAAVGGSTRTGLNYPLRRCVPTAELDHRSSRSGGELLMSVWAWVTEIPIPFH
jgi:hypothetical protein